MNKLNKCLKCKVDLDEHETYELQCRETGELCWGCMDDHLNDEAGGCEACWREFRNCFAAEEP
jgi:hypothetical protein